MQMPCSHVSLSEQGFSSEQGPSTFSCWHPPPGTQISLVQGFWSSQSSEPMPTQNPELQESPVVHVFWSSHGPLMAAKMHPLDGSHSSSVHGFPSAHGSSMLPLHSPPTQLSLMVQTSPSLQGEVFGSLLQPLAGTQ